MKNVLLAAVLTLGFAILFAGTAAAQAQQYRTEVCVNASDEAQARLLFPNASFHVFPDLLEPDMNGWRITYTGRDKNMTDAEEIYLRRREFNRRVPGE